MFELGFEAKMGIQKRYETETLKSEVRPYKGPLAGRNGVAFLSLHSALAFVGTQSWEGLWEHGQFRHLSVDKQAEDKEGGEKHQGL